MVLTMLDHRSRRNGSEGFGKPWFELDLKESNMLTAFLYCTSSRVMSRDMSLDLKDGQENLQALSFTIH